jgi:hypothetical protein
MNIENKDRFFQEAYRMLLCNGILALEGFMAGPKGKTQLAV